MPVLMIATYGDGDKVDVMNMAWGGICSENMIALNITESHKTVENIKKRGAFTVALADLKTMAESDFFGIVSGNDTADKFERSGMHAAKSSHVDAPIIEEYPVTMECKVAEIGEAVSGFRVVGEIVNVTAREEVLDEKGRIDPERMEVLAFDNFTMRYYVVNKSVGKAWNAGKDLVKK